jgi:ubiquitin C-terminal hydrolase/uncharacterized protein YjbI with pentapeptide repeats
MEYHGGYDMATFFKRTVSIALGLVLATAMLYAPLLAMTQPSQTTYSSSGIRTNNSAPSISSANSTNTHTEVKPPSKEDAKLANTQKDTSAQAPSTPTPTAQTATQAQAPVEEKHPYYFDCKLPSNQQVRWIPTKGLENAGNSCYASSLMQCLFAITPLMINISTMQESKDPVVEGFRQLVQEKIAQASTNQTAHNYQKLYQSIRNQFFPTEGYQQQDAFLFFVRLSNVLGDQANIFKGTYSSTVTCTPHNHQSENNVDEPCLSLAIPTKETTETAVPLARAINNHFPTKETLKEVDKDTKELKNTHKCDPCGKIIVAALKDTYLKKLPTVLVINIKRFSADYTKKNTTPISIPYEFTLQTTYPSEQASPPTPYHLASVVIHHGTAIDGGHYTALVKNPGNQTWYDCNDSTVTQLTNVDQLQTQGYWQHADSNPTMLFYVRNDVITRYADANKQAHTQAATQTTAQQQVQTNNTTASAATPQIASKTTATQSGTNNAFADLFPSTPSATSQTIQSPKKSTCERITNWFWSWFASKVDIPQATTNTTTKPKANTTTSTLTDPLADFIKALDESIKKSPHNGSDRDYAAIKAGEKKCAKFNLAGKDLSKLNLTDVDLSDAILTNAIMTETNCTRTNLTNTNLTGAQLRKTILNDAIVNNTIFSGATLSDMYIDGKIQGIKAQKTIFNDCSFCAHLIQSDLTGATFNSCTFDMLGSLMTKWTGSQINKSNIKLGYIIGSNFSNTHFNRVNFDLLAIIDTPFRSAVIDHLNMTDCQLGDVSFNNSTINDLEMKSVVGMPPTRDAWNGFREVFKNSRRGFINTYIDQNMPEHMDEEKTPYSVSFTEATLNNCLVTDSAFNEASFNRAHISNTNFTNTGIFSTSFSEAQIESVVFSRGTLEQILMDQIQADTVIMDHMDLIAISFYRARLRRLFVQNPPTIPNPDNKIGSPTTRLGAGISFDHARIENSCFIGSTLTEDEKTARYKTLSYIDQADLKLASIIKGVFHSLNTAKGQQEIDLLLNCGTDLDVSANAFNGTSLVGVYFIDIYFPMIEATVFDNLAATLQCNFDRVFFVYPANIHLHDQICSNLRNHGALVNGVPADGQRHTWPQDYARNNDTALNEMLGIARKRLTGQLS